MLDTAIIEQLKNAFAGIEKKTELVVLSSQHEKQDELVDMLGQVASCHPSIELVFGKEEVSVPQFSIRVEGKATGISFVGIPGGHEFTSFVLAILNANGLGKLPDKGIMQRIKAIKGPIKLETYISLSCENCPEVVQALNVMAIEHPEFEHQMIDGGLVQEKVEALNIQGVPSVMHGKELLHSGKSDLAQLIGLLESHFGKTVVDAVKGTENQDLGSYDMVVIGGGPAGASAAIYTARKGFKTAIVAGRFGGQLQDTKGIQNMISIPYTEGPQLTAALQKHVDEYEIDVFEHRNVLSVTNGESKTIALDSGESISARSMIVATGAKWRQLGVKGEKEYIGRGVAYCPHCDGPYYKGKDVAVVGGGNSGVEAAIDLAGIVNRVILIEYAESLKADSVLVKKLKSLPNVEILTNAQTMEVMGDGNKVVGLQYKNRESGEISAIDLDGVFVQIGLLPNSDFIKDVVETNKYGEIVVDDKGRTNVKGIYAAGDVTTIPFKQIIISLGEGAKAALTAFEDNMAS